MMSIKTIPGGVSLRRNPRFWAALQVVALLALSVCLAVVLISLREQVSRLGDWRYAGGFLIEAADSASMFIPTPGHAYILAMAETLHPLLLGVIGGVGAALGEMTGYFVGVRGQEVLPNKGRLYGVFRTVMTRWGGPALFFFAVLPVPFDVAGLWAGTVRYPLWRFFLYVTPGKVIKVTGIALAGYYGIPWLLRLV